jgi:hypothetical protein
MQKILIVASAQYFCFGGASNNACGGAFLGSVS